MPRSSSYRSKKHNKIAIAAKKGWLKRNQQVNQHKVEHEIDFPDEEVIESVSESSMNEVYNANIDLCEDPEDLCDVDICIETNPNWCLKKYDRDIDNQKTHEKGVTPLAEYQSIMDHILEVEIEPKEQSPISGYRIVELGYVLDWAVQLQYNHSKVCTLGKVYVKEERRRTTGLVSQIIFNCTACEKSFKFFTEDPKKSVVNTAAVWGTLSTGSTYSHLTELLSVMDIPTMPQKMFYNIENELGEEWKKSLGRSMEDAGKREKLHAIEAGQISEDGTPWITVYVDGSWSKRSYGTNFNALSGMVGIIGRFTGELIFLSVRNKYCSVCAHAINKNETAKDHICYKNWSNSASAMEQDMAVEGFKTSIEMHGVKYLKFIADGDSSVWANLTKKVAYGAQIKKVECTNHALKNYGKRLYNIKKDRHINVKGRTLLTEKKIKLLKKRAKCSIYEHAKSGNNDVALLRKDLEFGLHHVFGDHLECREGICKKLGDQSKNKIPDLKTTNIYFHLHGAIDLLIRKAHLLIENENNNAAERLMNIVSRFNMGKRLNLVQRGSYQRRVYISGLRYNKKISWHGSPWKNYTGQSPGNYYKKFMETSAQKKSTINKAKKRLFTNNEKEIEAIEKKKQKINIEYGPNAEEPEDPDLIKILCEKTLQKLQIDVAERDRIESNSIGQFGNETYELERKLRLTASLFGQVIRKKATTPCHNLVKACLQKQYIFAESIEFGIAKEKVALILFQKKTGLEVRPSGLWVDLDHGYLGASPDGIVDKERAIVEIKCLFSANKLVNMGTIEDVVKELKKQKKRCCLEISNNKVQLKKNDVYYYQVQGQLNITKAEKCYFVVYINDTIELFISEISRDQEFWNEKMLPKLKKFYEECIAPEIIRNNISKGLKCIDSNDIKEAIKKKEEKEKNKKKVK